MPCGWFLSLQAILFTLVLFIKKEWWFCTPFCQLWKLNSERCLLSLEEKLKPVPVMDDFAIYLFFLVILNVFCLFITFIHLKNYCQEHTHIFSLMKEVYPRLPFQKSFITVDIIPSTGFWITCRASNRILQMNKKICMWKSDIKCRGLLNIMRPNIMSYFLYVPLKFMISFKPYWSALLFTSCNQWIETLRPDIKLHKGVYLKYRTVISQLL